MDRTDGEDEMGKTKKKKTSIVDAQRELRTLAKDAVRLWGCVRELGEELDEPLSEAQAQGLEPETVATFVASWLLTTDETPLSEVAERLEELSRLRQSDIDARWRERLPTVLADEASRQLGELRNLAEAVTEAASAGDGDRLAEAMETLCRQLEDGGPELEDLAARCRRYLAEKA
jgi:hypothetical protein